MKDKNNFSFISNQGKVSICCAEQCYGFLNVTLNVSFHLFSDSLRLSLHQPHKYRGQRIFLSTFFMWKFTGLFTQYSTPSTQYKRVFIKITMITDEGAVNRNIFSFSACYFQKFYNQKLPQKGKKAYFQFQCLLFPKVL